MAHFVHLSEGQYGHRSPALTLDRNGVLWVAWQSYRSSGDRILARSLTDEKIGPLLVIGEEAEINFQPALAADGQGRIWVAWSGSHEGEWCVLARPIVNGQPGTAIRLSESNSPAFSPVAAADADGRVWVAWVMLSDAQHRLVGRYLDDDGWSAAALLGKGTDLFTTTP